MENLATISLENLQKLTGKFRRNHERKKSTTKKNTYLDELHSVEDEISKFVDFVA